MATNRVSRFIIWICSKFTRTEIEFIVTELSNILLNRNPEIKPKDHFKEQHPSYREFGVDPKQPIPATPLKKKSLQTGKHF